jgi:hypothetical protein
MTKEQFVKIIQTQLANGNVTSALMGKYHPAEIEKFIEMAYNDVVGKAYGQSQRYSDFSQLDNHIKAYKNVPVTYDKDLCEYYSILPAPIIQIPDNQSIRLISPMLDQGYAFVYEDNSSTAVFNELEVNALDDSGSYQVEASQIRYKSGMTDDMAKAGMLMKLVVQFDALDDDDEVYMPAGQSTLISQIVVEYLSQRKAGPEQTNNDSTSKTV